MSQAEAGKGSKPRPFSISHEEWLNRWDAIFGRDLKEKSEQDKNKKFIEENSNLNFNTHKGKYDQAN